MTADQIARVRRMAQDLRHSAIPDEREDAAALTALLAAVDRMPTRDQLTGIEWAGDALSEGAEICPATSTAVACDDMPTIGLTVTTRGTVAFHVFGGCW